ncbi:MAG TPA: hypothetical protein VN081_02655 [Dongiaceae bacterium]|nr:hypothetical protein [Dongiaceae bacterium]
MRVIKRTKNKLLFGGIAVAIVAVLIIGGVLLLNHPASPSPASSAKTPAEQPPFTAVLPKGKTINQLGGWNRLSPPNSDPVYVYNDTIDDIAITVTEQPLPQALQTDTATQIASLAKGYNATDQLKAGDTTVYIGTSAKGPQSVILSKSNLLILMKSQATINDSAWSTYAESLQ